MKKSSEFEDILDECLDRLIKGETVEQCLRSYPEQLPELEPLLRTAQAARDASAITPRAEFKAKARYEFRSALHTEVSQRPQLISVFKRGWVMAVMVIGILLVSGGGIALAAIDSMPDSPFYPVKLATEQVQLALVPSTVDKTSFSAALVDRRIVEIIYLANKGDARQLEATNMRLDEELTTLIALVSIEGVETVTVEEAPGMLVEEPALAPPAPEETPAPTPSLPSMAAPSPDMGADMRTEGVPVENGGRANLKIKITSNADRHLEMLQSVLERAKPSVKSALYQAIIISENGYRKAIDALNWP